MTPHLIPERFGPLQDVRIVSSGTLIAQPWACEIAAEMGAEVIHIERPEVGEAVWRQLGIRLPARDGKGEVATNWIQERRNMLCVTLDLSQPRGQGIFLDLVKRADIWMENSQPGTYARRGLDDRTVLAVNPKLVITHVSGYGHTGDPRYIHRASYDIVAQAFGGSLHLTGFPDPEPPTRAAPWTTDYITALFALSSSLAGLTHARSTGVGQSIDLAQYEAVFRTLGGTMLEYFHTGLVRERTGNKASGFQPLDVFQAKDGWVVIGAVGAVYDRLLPVIGLDPAEEKWQRARVELESIEGIEFDAILRGWVNEHTVEEVVELLNQARVACSEVLSAKDMAENPQYRARDMLVEWEDEQVGRVKGIGIVPKFSATPGKVWRGSVPIGYDNELVYGRLLGLDSEELESLRQDKII